MSKKILIVLIIILSVFIILGLAINILKYGKIEKIAISLNNERVVEEQEDTKNIIENTEEIKESGNTEEINKDKLIDENVVQNTIVNELEKKTIETKQVTNSNNKVQSNSKSENIEKTTQQETEKTNELEKTSSPDIAPSKETSSKKQETKDTQYCTNINNHMITVGNSNKWFDTKEEAIAYYKQVQNLTEEEYKKGKLTFDEYIDKCTYGHEEWDCPLCHKWTINLYYD